MKQQSDIRQQRRSDVNNIRLVAIGGIAGIVAIAAVALWFNWPGDSAQSTATEVDPMSMIG